MRKILRNLTLALATGFFVSYIPARIQRGKRWTGAGTLGALWGLVSWHLIPLSPVPQLAIITLATALSIFICGEAEMIFGNKDDQRIVLDEWVGYWTAAALLPRSAAYLVSAFVLFRIFDMWKSPPGRTLARLPGGPGVVLDDILAGIYTNLALQACRFFLSS